MEKICMGIERQHYRSPNINVCFKASIHGVVGDEQYRDALKTVCTQHPMITCVLQADHDNNLWYIPDKTEPGLEIYESNNGFDWLMWYQREDSIPFDFSNGPLVKFCIIRKEGRTDIILLGHHVIGDGIGYLNLLRDFLLALDGNKSVQPMELISNNTLKDKPKLSDLAFGFAKNLNEGWLNDPKDISEQEYLEFFHSYRELSQPAMYLNTLESSELSGLISKCKESGLTVNEAISTAFVMALLECEHYKNDNIKLGVAASVRDEMVKPMQHTMGNFTTGISIFAPKGNKKSFVESAKIIKQLLVEKLDVPENRGVGISNLGTQNMGEFNHFSVEDVFFVPPVYPSNLVTIGVITENGNLHFCLRYSQAYLSDTIIKEVYDNAIKLLIE